MLICEKTDELMALYMDCKNIIAPLFPELNKKEEASSANSNIVSELLDKMTDALESMDTLAMDEVLEEMSGYQFIPAQTQCFEKLRSAAEGFDIDMCSSIVEIWRQIAASQAKMNTASADNVKEMLTKMKNALDEFDTLLIDEVVEQMEKMQFSDEQVGLYSRLKNAAEDSDIDLCGQIIQEWGKLL